MDKVVVVVFKVYLLGVIERYLLYVDVIIVVVVNSLIYYC